MFQLVCLIRVNDEDGPSFLGFFKSVEAAKQSVSELPLESQNLEWARDKGQWLHAWSGHDTYYIHQLPGWYNDQCRVDATEDLNP